MNSLQKLHAHSFRLPPLQDPPRSEAVTGPSVDQDHETEAAESSARVSSVPIRLGKNGKRLPDPSSDDDPDSDIEEEEEGEEEPREVEAALCTFPARSLRHWHEALN